MSLRRPKQIPPNAELYCPQYREFDRKAREDSKIRFKEHVTGRRQLLVQCIDPAIAEIRSAKLALEFGHLPQYIDDDKIINDAIGTMFKCIDKWDGVQFSKVFIAEFNKSGKEMDASKFSTIAKNHQDQTSWKICGQFFAKYIAQARQYIHHYCQSILNITMNQKQEMIKLGCISYAVSLLEATIRFHRTKAKPLIRYKTLVKSTKIHIELEKLYSELTVKKFISAAKKRRKAKDGKTTVKSNEFHQQLLDCCKTLYRRQKQNVYNMFNIVVANDMNGIGDEFKDDDEDINSVYPSDLLSEADADTISTNTDNNASGYIPYESTSIFSQQSTHQNHNRSTTSSRSRSRSQSPREFQRTDPRDYSIRNDMRQSLRNRDKQNRSHTRESLINQVRNNRNNNDNTYTYPSNIGIHHNNNNTMLLPEVNVSTERGVNSLSQYQFQPGADIQQVSLSGSRMTFTETNTIVDNIGDGYCNLCGYVDSNCQCNNNMNMSMSFIDDATSNTNSNSHQSQSPEINYARQCEILTRENEELRRQRDECRRLLQQMQVMQNQHQQQYIQYPSMHTLPSYQSQPQYVLPQNDITYFNALPNQLRFIQPSMIIRGSSLNDDNNGNNNNDINMGLNALNLMNNNNDRMSSSPPFIDNNNGNDNNGVDIIVDGDVDIPSIPNN